MMPLHRLAARSAWSRRGTLLWVVVSIALATLLMLSIERIRTDARASFRQAVSGTDLIVGPRTGSVQLLLYAVFRLGSATHNIRLDSLQDLARHRAVAWVVPLSLGDSHRGFPVLGTQPAYFEHFRHGDRQPLRLAQGRPFNAGLDGLFEAVLGAEVAQREGHRLDQPIVLRHGGGQDLGTDHADKPFKVVGILARTGTPADRTVHVNLESLSAVHLDWLAGAPLPGLRVPAEQARKFDLTPKEVTAALVGLKNRNAVFAVQREVAGHEPEPLMAILPGVALDELWEVVGAGEQALLGISALVAVVSLVGLMAVVLAGLNERRRELAVLRAVGASPIHIGLLLAFEGLWITLLGLLLGTALMAALVVGAGAWLQSAWGVSLQLWPPTPTQLVVLVAVGAAGWVASAVPAWRAYRWSLADGLTPPP
ncbi:MAG: ABC transporter permease [Pseudomonadota bacterium]